MSPEVIWCTLSLRIVYYYSARTFVFVHSLDQVQSFVGVDLKRVLVRSDGTCLFP